MSYREARSSAGGGQPAALGRGAESRPLSAALHLAGCARQDFDDLGFGLGVAFELLEGGLAQIIERGLDQRRNAAAIVVAIVLADATPHAGDLAADGGETLQHGVDQVTV